MSLRTAWIMVVVPHSRLRKNPLASSLVPHDSSPVLTIPGTRIMGCFFVYPRSTMRFPTLKSRLASAFFAFSTKVILLVSSSRSAHSGSWIPRDICEMARLMLCSALLASPVPSPTAPPASCPVSVSMLSGGIWLSGVSVSASASPSTMPAGKKNLRPKIQARQDGGRAGGALCRRKSTSDRSISSQGVPGAAVRGREQSQRRSRYANDGQRD